LYEKTRYLSSSILREAWRLQRRFQVGRPRPRALDCAAHSCQRIEDVYNDYEHTRQKQKARAAMNPKDIVRTGYDKISHVYRGDALDQNDPASIQYTQWITELVAMLSSAAAVLDLGCGNGIP
jgi:hypothetical protein